MRFLPVFLDLSRGVVGLVGGSREAQSKLRLLLAAGASVRWYSTNGYQIAEETLTASPAASLKISLADPRQARFSDLIAVVSAVGDTLDEDVAARARCHNIPVNVVDRPDLSTFIFPAIVDRGDVVVAIGTGGASPVLARRLRERIEALLPARIGDLAALMGRFRARTGRAQRGTGAQRQFWERVVDGPIGAAALAGRWRDAESALARASRCADDVSAPCGVVFLVGAGPGDPDLLTLRALQVLQNADVVFYDESVTAEVLDRARRDADRVFVGRRAGRPGMDREAIDQRVADAALQGLNVVYLKGGSPFVFGQRGEELDHLRQLGVTVVVVPGVAASSFECPAHTEMAA